MTVVALGVSEGATPHHTACQIERQKSKILGIISKAHRTFKREGEGSRGGGGGGGGRKVGEGMDKETDRAEEKEITL